MTVGLKEFKSALNQIQPYVKKTQLQRCEKLEDYLHTSHRIFLKLENEQPTKSFKVRGAFHILLNLTDEEKSKGIATRSSGNFAQAIAYAGQLLNIKARIVMSTNAPEVKKRATESYHPDLIFVGTTHEEAEKKVEEISKDTGAIAISPYNHHDVIVGQGTLALEVYEEQPQIHHFFCPIGGGGLMGGCSTALKLLNREVEIVGVEPEGAADYCLYRMTGQAAYLSPVTTICDGLRAPQVGFLNRPLLDQYVDKVSLVSDFSVIKAMKFLRDYLGLIVEPSGAAALAGLMHVTEPLEGDTVCVITGANVDSNYYEKWMKEV